MSLKISKELSLPIEVAGEAIGILATRGAGKSYTSAVLIEELNRAEIQFVVLDVSGVYWGLRSSSDGKKEGIGVIILGGSHGDVPLESTAGTLIADLLVDTGQNMILDMSDFPTKAAQTRFVTDLAERLYRRKARNRTTIHLIIDEAQEFIPQKPYRNEARMLGAMETLVRTGRSRGIGATLITQRSATLNKNVLDLIETLVVMRILGPRDRKAIEGWISYKAADDDEGVIESVPGLPTGTAWVWSPVRGLLKKAAIRRIETFDSYATPKPGHVKKEPMKMATINIESLGEQIKATADRAKAEDPRELRKRVAELECELAKKEVAVKTREVAVLKDSQIKRLEQVIIGMGKMAGQYGAKMDAYWKTFDSAASVILDAMNKRGNGAPLPKDFVEMKDIGVAIEKSGNKKLIADGFGETNPTRQSTHLGLKGPEQRILDALMWFEAVGVRSPENAAVAFMAGYSPKGGAYMNPRGKLNKENLISYGGGGTVMLTALGRAFARDPGIARTSEGLQEAVLKKLPGPERRLLTEVIKCYPEEISNEMLAARAGYAVGGGAFMNPRGRLRTLGLIEYPAPGVVKARDILFVR